MEHADTLSRLVVLSSPPVHLVARSFLPAAPITRRRGNVFSCSPLDGQSTGGCCGRSGLRIQRSHLKLLDVAQHDGSAGLDAVGDQFGGIGLENGREKDLYRLSLGRSGDALRRTGSHSVYLGPPPGLMVGSSKEGATSGGRSPEAFFAHGPAGCIDLCRSIVAFSCPVEAFATQCR